MKISRKHKHGAEVPTHALNDIMFFLLLFFLIISTLANPNVIKVPLPKSDANEKTQKAHITLTVTEEKKYYVDKKEIAFDEIEGLLLTETKKIGDNTVIVRIPFDLQVQDLVDLLQIGMKNDLKVIIATEASK